MNTILKKLALVCFASFVISANVIAADNRVIRITTGEWPPYLGEKLPAYGTVTAIITRTFEKMGYRVQYGFFPWARSLKLVEKKDWDAAAIWTMTPSRQDSFYASDPVMTETYAMFSLKGAPVAFKTLNDLGGQRVGVVRSYEYPEEFMKLSREKAFTTMENESEALLFKNLLRGQIAAAVMNYDVGVWLINNELSSAEQARLEIPSFRFGPSPLSLLFAKTDANKALVEQFNLLLPTAIKNKP